MAISWDVRNVSKGNAGYTLKADAKIGDFTRDYALRTPSKDLADAFEYATRGVTPSHAKLRQKVEIIRSFMSDVVPSEASLGGVDTDYIDVFPNS